MTGVAEWVTAKNVRPMGVEKAATFVQIPHNWNVQTVGAVQVAFSCPIALESAWFQPSKHN